MAGSGNKRGPGNCSGLPFKPMTDVQMTQTHSKSRQQAEKAFGLIQGRGQRSDHPVESPDADTQAREEKTLRLKQARLAKEAEARVRATSALIKLRAAKS